MATKLQEDTARDVARIKALVEAGTDRRVVVELERGARVAVSDTTDTFYSVFALLPGSTAYAGNGIGLHRSPITGEISGDDQLHRLSLVVKRAYRAAA